MDKSNKNRATYQEKQSFFFNRFLGFIEVLNGNSYICSMGKEKEEKRKKSKKYSGKYKKYGFDKQSTSQPGVPKRQRRGGVPLPKFDGTIRLNKYLSNAGVCSRREADVLIKSGVVSVNGKIVTEMGVKVKPTDTVKYDSITLQLEKKHYILMNKPAKMKLKDNPNHKNVHQLVRKKYRAEVVPVGKMNAETCGLLLMTNDSDMVKKLTHPKFKVNQLYHVILDKPIAKKDLEQLTKGLYVDNKMFSVKEANLVKGKSPHEIGIRLLSSKDNIVQLMLGKLGYTIKKLDRVGYAGLTKKDLPRGFYRELEEREIGFLKMS